MITRVLDAQGHVLHDCRDAGCTTSWDGYDIATGDPVEGRHDPDPAVWQVDGDTARHAPAPTE